MTSPSLKLIWIDLDNSPHVPFFKPIIKELEDRGYRVAVTTRECSQTCGLADLLSVKYTKIGKHYGGKKINKVFGTLYRSGQLALFMQKERPALAISHGSRSQFLAAKWLRVPSVGITDYEFSDILIWPTWFIMPEVISGDHIKLRDKNKLKYPGIKEDVYVPGFRPAPEIKENLGINGNELLVTIRPPATEAHYHNSESEALFVAAVNRLEQIDQVRMIILPRYESQKEMILRTWPDLIKSRKIVVPDQVVDGLNLLWHSDLVISGGGTMNREAAALGVPVYSIFRGKIGAVDHWLNEQGRLILVETIEDVFQKIQVQKRVKNLSSVGNSSKALTTIIKNIEYILGQSCPK